MDGAETPRGIANFVLSPSIKKDNAIVSQGIISETVIWWQPGRWAIDVEIIVRVIEREDEADTGRGKRRFSIEVRSCCKAEKATWVL